MNQNSDFISLFTQLYPGFFDQDFIRAMPPEDVSEEMVMFLADFNRDAIDLSCPADVAFGPYEGSRDKLYEAVSKVVKSWVNNYTAARDEEIYCATVGDDIAAFCLVKNFGNAKFRGKTVKVGGPGCVGTVPDFRRKGIGLEMIRNATAILQDRKFDISYVHWTGVAHWYAKLGYKTVVRWNCNGVVLA